MSFARRNWPSQGLYPNLKLCKWFEQHKVAFLNLWLSFFNLPGGLLNGEETELRIEGHEWGAFFKRRSGFPNLPPVHIIGPV